MTTEAQASRLQAQATKNGANTVEADRSASPGRGEAKTGLSRQVLLQTGEVGCSFDDLRAGITYRRNPDFLPAVCAMLKRLGVTAGANEWIFQDGDMRRNPRYCPDIVLECLRLVQDGGIPEFLEVKR